MTTLLDLLKPEFGPRTAIALPDANVRVTYDGLRRQVKDLADALTAAGIGRTDRVGMALPNGLPTIVGFLAASMAGVAAPLNPAYRDEEFRFFLEDTSAKVLLLPPDGAEAARQAAAATKVPVLVLDMDASGVVHLRHAEHADHAEGRGGRGAGHGARSAAHPHDPALILHTSGSTGRPKRVPLSHANLSISAANVAKTYGLTADDVSMCVMPLFHVHGLVASTLATLSTGGTVVVPAKFSPLSFWRVAKEYNATWYSAVPTIHQLLLARAEGQTAKPAGAEKLRFIRSCSASLPPQVMHDLESAFGAPVLEAYGMTEAAHQMASNPLPPRAHKAGSVGPGTGVGIRIMDEHGKTLGTDERGEVCIHGPNVIKGYENNPDANATSFHGEWFRTGDQGFLDADGYLTLVGRLKELINRGGEKISPREIDEVLLAHPAVAEAVCFGVPHPTWGEEVAACVVLREGVGDVDLMGYCREKLAEFKRPKQIHVTTTIPRTATGKIQRRIVAQAFSSSAS